MTFPLLNADSTVEASLFHLRICVLSVSLIALFCNLTRSEWCSQIWIVISHLKTLFSQCNPPCRDFPSMLRSIVRNTSIFLLGNNSCSPQSSQYRLKSTFCLVLYYNRTLAEWLFFLSFRVSRSTCLRSHLTLRLICWSIWHLSVIPRR